MSAQANGARDCLVPGTTATKLRTVLHVYTPTHSCSQTEKLKRSCGAAMNKTPVTKSISLWEAHQSGSVHRMRRCLSDYFV